MTGLQEKRRISAATPTVWREGREARGHAFRVGHPHNGGKRQCASIELESTEVFIKTAKKILVLLYDGGGERSAQKTHCEHSVSENA